jgi:hypothetical protein
MTEADPQQKIAFAQFLADVRQRVITTLARRSQMSAVGLTNG